MAKKSKSLILKKGSIRKQVWYEDQLWHVVKIFHPTKLDCFILCQRLSGAVHGLSGDDSDVFDEVTMKLIDVQNHEFYFATKKVFKLMEEKGLHEKQLKSIRESLTDIWLNQLKY